MLKTFKSIAGAAIILATISTVSARAMVATEAPKVERIEKQTVAKAQTQTPFVWLVLGVGF
jgi:hypothetical protein